MIWNCVSDIKKNVDPPPFGNYEYKSEDHDPAFVLT